MLFLEDPIGAPSEHARIALVTHPEPVNGDAVQLVDAGLQLVPPRDVVGRARREDVDLRVAREVFRDVAGVKFCAAVDRLAVSLDDDGELHCVSGSGTGRPTGSDGCESAPVNCSRSSVITVSFSAPPSGPSSPSGPLSAPPSPGAACPAITSAAGGPVRRP